MSATRIQCCWYNNYTNVLVSYSAVNNNYIGAVSTSLYRYGAGSVHFSSFGCIGDETNILSCSHSLPQSYCSSHSNDVGVICRGIIMRKSYKVFMF